MTLYGLCITLHLLAMSLWIGHMLVWSLITGPALKRIDAAGHRRDAARAQPELGGLGWPALAVLVATGLYMLHWRGRARRSRTLRSWTRQGGGAGPEALAGDGDDSLPGFRRPSPRADRDLRQHAGGLIVLAGSVVLVRAGM